MKKLILILTILVIVTSCKQKATEKVQSENIETAEKRDEAAKNLPIMTFEKTEHDFGTLKQGTAVETTFTFTNTGNGPLIITNAKSSCGCTIPEYPKDKVIAPGETGELLVKFNGAGKNKVKKNVTITANTLKGSEKLQIMAFIEPKEVK